MYGPGSMDTKLSPINSHLSNKMYNVDHTGAGQGRENPAWASGLEVPKETVRDRAAGPLGASSVAGGGGVGSHREARRRTFKLSDSGGNPFTPQSSRSLPDTPAGSTPFRPLGNWVIKSNWYPDSWELLDYSHLLWGLRTQKGGEEPRGRCMADIRGFVFPFRVNLWI